MKQLNRTLCALIMASSATLSLHALADTPQKAWSLTGFNEPESVLPHPNKDILYVSNINGSPVEKNGEGYISLVSSDGKMIQQKWMTGMHAPKGMALHGDHLYVADMQTLHIIDHTKGVLVTSVTAAASTMLNDIAVDTNGNVYISDLLGGGIYHYSADSSRPQLSQWITPKTLPHPNGLFFDKKSNALLLATWGEGLQNDFSTTTLGGLYRIQLTDKKITPFQDAQQFGNLDGIARINNTWIVNDWMNGNVFTYDEQGSGKKGLKKYFNAGKHAADISSKGQYLYVPVMFDKKVDVYKVK